MFKTRQIIFFCIFILLSILVNPVLASKTDDKTFLNKDKYLYILIHGITGERRGWYKDRDNFIKYLENDLGLKGRIWAYSYIKYDDPITTYSKEFGDLSYAEEVRQKIKTEELIEDVDRLDVDGKTKAKCIRIEVKGCRAAVVKEEPKYNSSGIEPGQTWLTEAQRDYRRYLFNKEDVASRQQKKWTTFLDIPDELIPTHFVVIAHSLGGLSVRKYIVSDYYDHTRPIDKIIFFDSPHLGSWGTKMKKNQKTILNQIGQTFELGFDVLEGWNKFSAPNEVIQYILSHPLRPTIWELMIQAIKFDFGTIKNGSNGLGQVAVEVILNQFVTEVDQSPGLKDVDAEGDFIKTLNQEDPQDEIKYRLFTVRGGISTSEETSDLLGKVGGGIWVGGKIFGFSSLQRDVNAYYSLIQPEFWELPNKTSQMMSLTAAWIIPYGQFLKDGGLLMTHESSSGQGVKLFENSDTKRWEETYYSEGLETAVKTAEDLYIAIFTADALMGFNPSMKVAYFAPMAIIASGLALGELGNFSNAEKKNTLLETILAHQEIIQDSLISDSTGNNKFYEALFDTPQISLNENGKILNPAKNVQLGVYTPLKESKDRVIETSSLQTQSLKTQILTISDKKYQAQNIQKQTQNTGDGLIVYLDGQDQKLNAIMTDQETVYIKGFVNDFMPSKLRNLDYSFNFSGWTDFKASMDSDGYFTLGPIPLSEGQNIIAFKMKNLAKASSPSPFSKIGEGEIVRQSIFTLLRLRRGAGSEAVA